MSYQYSNLLDPATIATSISSQPTPSTARSTFTASLSSSSYQILFQGLPLDVSEKDLRDLLLSPSIGLPASSTSVKCMFSAEGAFLGIALVQVGNEVDAERIRREYSGQIIDGTYRLTVQHLLPPTQPLPSSTSIAPFPLPTAAAPAQQPRSQPKQQQPKVKMASAANGGSDKAPGLKLLARMSKPGQGRALVGTVGGGKGGQLALLAQQQANLRSTPRGKHLLSRLASSPASLSTTHTHSVMSRPKQARLSSGTDKVGRAKGRPGVGRDAMDVDHNVVGGQKGGAGAGAGKEGAGKQGRPGKAVGKTQVELDEEMRVWERARRFGA